MIKSKDKAKEGYVKVTFNREEFWVDPSTIKIEGITLGETLKQVKTLQITLDDFIKTTNLTLSFLIKRQKELEKELETYKKAVESFMTDVVKGGIQ